MPNRGFAGQGERVGGAGLQPALILREAQAWRGRGWACLLLCHDPSLLSCDALPNVATVCLGVMAPCGGMGVLELGVGQRGGGGGYGCVGRRRREHRGMEGQLQSTRWDRGRGFRHSLVACRHCLAAQNLVESILTLARNTTREYLLRRSVAESVVRDLLLLRFTPEELRLVSW